MIFKKLKLKLFLKQRVDGNVTEILHVANNEISNNSLG